MFTKKWLASPDTQRIILYFLAWKLLVFFFAYLGVVFLSLRSPNFFGGGLENYLEHPLFWGWANFDGEHYLSIAQFGYKALEHSFFPFYPILMRLLGGVSLVHLVWAGLLISNAFFLASLFLFWRLLRLDYSERISFFISVSLIVFPTSFYFGAVYTESIFLFFTLLFFYLVRQRFWWQSGVVGSLASATRIFGILFIPSFLVEWWQRYKDRRFISVSFVGSLVLIPFGLIIFMWSLYKTTGNPLAFYTELSTFGEQRGGLVVLPQTFWRYIKIFSTVSQFDPLYLTVSMEILIAVFGLIAIIWGFLKRVRLSYLVFAFSGYVIATLPGSFSSLPRYVLVLFPFFIVLGLFLTNRGKIAQLAFFLISVILLAIETALFIRGYWVA